MGPSGNASLSAMMNLGKANRSVALMAKLPQYLNLFAKILVVARYY